ncbi:CRISPR-associated endonuclease-helicase Cas3 protein [Salinisphaera shabanensis E1L3A]|uniref:CRISPR-associated endonuclease-helicase Cas3 protein n=1 Tax=Salinisphaera shabanensis E1L3A TaxID=1033802 RepID=F7QAM8_9GAMM|nr:CRISPR-associated helicase/endonuclease Cas3 [Salinisphaera shabanensis]ERJ17419.1 CRISPR-associated endonuclease-helicase Cas3 protein [Salinisphaera shabanensis E1L3A]
MKQEEGQQRPLELKRAFSALSPQARSIWSKSAADDGAGHNLLAHLLDVAAVAEALLEHEPPTTLDWVSRALGLPREGCIRWVTALAGLHDFGKAIPGFVIKWPVGQMRAQAAGLDFPDEATGRDNHSLATAALLAEPLQQLTQAPRGWVIAVVQAIAAHHGRHFRADEQSQGRPKREPAAWAAARSEILEAYWQTLKPSGRPAHADLDLAAVNWLAGLTSAADWIASNVEWFELGERRDELHDYYEHARLLAVDALADAGWPRFQPLLAEPEVAETLLERIRGRPTAPRPLQQAGDALIKQAQGSTLLLVEAPMGEGKTELAYLAYLRLQSTNAHRGLYVASPTQATGNALFGRTERFLSAFLRERADIQLVHGGAAMNAQLRHLRDIAHDKHETLAASAWFSQRRRPLLSPYGVGTVDQALLGVLNAKHHFVRLWGLANRVVVLDEVHAYDTYTSVLIEALVRWLKAMGSSVVLMSATLPRSKRDRLVQAWGADPQAVQESAYPRLTQIDAHSIRSKSFACRPLAPIAVHAVDESLEAIKSQAIALLADGGCGAVIVNTVDRAQILFRLLETHAQASDIEMILFHARFPADQRADIEKRVLSLFGESNDANSEVRPSKGLLIATQVAEQSLDLDFDFMLSDLAPIDLLLQRAGRMHRHDRERPAAHAQARLWVAGLHPDRLPALKETAWEYVYDPFVLGHTWACLRERETLQLPADIDALVQHVYSFPELPASVDAKTRDFIEIECYGARLGAETGKHQQAMDISIDPEEEPARAYQNKRFGGDDEEGMRNVTRLGPESVNLVPIDVIDGAWALDGTVVDPAQVPSDAIARQLYARQLRVSRKAVVLHCQQAELPVAFADHPLLRHLYPMPMVDGRCELSGQGLHLDPVLGLVYEGAEK